MKTSNLSAALLLLGGSIFASAQTSTSVENLTSIPSTTVRNGLGFNMASLKYEWEFKMAADAGATEVRFQPSWPAVQKMSGDFQMPENAATALNWCKTYGLQPLLVAAYGSPFESLGKFTVAQDCPAGSTSIKLNESVAGVEFPYCQVIGAGNKQIVPEGKYAYCGALITGADPNTNTITLAAATKVALTAGQTLIINKLLYPSCATSDPTDPSVVAYCNYAAYLAGQISAHGLVGRVELWNEPPWSHDPWDHRGAYYDSPPGGTISPNMGFAENLAATVAPSGAHYNWGGTNKSGTRSILSKFMSPPITAQQVADSISCEAFHPYGNSPEDALWDPTLLAAAPNTSNLWKTVLPGTNAGSNMNGAVKLALMNPALNFKHNISETGSYTEDNVRKARFVLRQYLGFLAGGLERVTFWCFAAKDASTIKSYGFVDEATQASTQAYTAMQGLVAMDMANLPAAPLAYAAGDLPTVPAYSGRYPLTTVSIVGRHTANDAKNVIYYVAWQRSHVPPGPVTNLAATSPGGKVVLTWSGNPNATQTVIERASSSGGPYSQMSENFDFTGRTYTDSTVSDGQTYYYVAVGSNPGGTSTNSNEVSVTVGGACNNKSLPPVGDAHVSWLTLDPPPAATVSVQLPDGTTATDAWDLVTRAEVPFTVSGNTATYAVSDNPVCLAVVSASGGGSPAHQRF